VYATRSLSPPPAGVTESAPEIMITFGLATWAAVTLYLLTGSWLPALVFLALIPPAPERPAGRKSLI